MGIPFESSRPESPLSVRRRKEIASLSRRKDRDRLGQLLIEGVRSVEAAVAAQAPLVEVLVTPTAQALPRVATLLQQVAVPIHCLAEADLARVSDVEASAGVLAVARIQRFPTDLLPTLHTLLALDGVQDPGNVGALLRVAAWFGLDAVLAGPGTADFFNPKVVRAAMGGLWDVHLATTDDLPGTLAHLRQHGWTVYGADLHGTAVQDWHPARPAVLVLGSEAHGLHPDVQACLDERVSIPGDPRRQGAESLNVAVAAGVLAQAWQQETLR
jgi:TrmH family RNA methyltransferase